MNHRIHKLVEENNKMSNERENILSENALLRQMSKVPDNFGEQIELFSNEQRQNAIFYKQKLLAMEREMEAIEKEVTRLRYEKIAMGGFMIKPGTLTKELTPAQQRFLEEYAVDLVHGKKEIPLTDQSKALKAEVDKLQAIIAQYEKILANKNFGEGQAGTSQLSAAHIDDQQMKTILKAISDQRNDIYQLFKSQPQPQNISQQPGTPGGSNINFNNNIYTNSNRPPKPIVGIFGDWNQVTEGQSYKFDSKLQLKSYDEELAGMDIDKAKYYIATMQLHNMETLELLRQRETEYSAVASEMELLREALRNSLKLQDELFVKHYYELNKNSEQTKGLRNENQDLKTFNIELTKRCEIFEQSLSAIQTRAPGSLEARLGEVSKIAAISETNIVKLARKYDALESEHNDMVKAWRVVDVDQNQRERVVVEKMNILLEWKADATEKMKILLDRLQTSVPADEHRALRSELELERQKYVALKTNEDQIILENTSLRGLKREKAEEVDRAKKLEDDMIGLENELNALHLRLVVIDKVYARHSEIFKRIAGILKANNISPLQYFQTVDISKDGYISSIEFKKAMEAMGIVMDRTEANTFFEFLDLDGSGMIDYIEFARKLKRLGVVIRSKEEELVNTLWNAITKTGMTLEAAYEAFAQNKNSDLTFVKMMQAFKELGILVDPKTASEFFKLVDISGNGSVSMAEFMHIFKQYNKINTSISSDSILDWKYDMMVRLDALCAEKNRDLEGVFKDIDTDSNGFISKQEFRVLFLKMGLNIEKNAFEQLYFQIDTNRSGQITFPEFLAYVNAAKKEAARINRIKVFENRLKANNQMSNESLVMEPDMMGGYTDPSTRLQLKIAQLEAKEKSGRRMASEYATRISRLEQEAAEQKTSVKSIEAGALDVRSELIREKERTARLERIAQTNISRSQAEGIKAQSENLRIENTQLRAALQTFRHLHEAAIREAKTLTVAVGRNDDENIHLRKEVRELQSESDENALIGKLFNQVLTEKWTEAAVNKKYDQALDDLRRAQMTVSSQEEKLKTIERDFFDFQTGAAEKVAHLDKQLQEARMAAQPMVSLAKLEELTLSLKRLANQKLELEISNKKLRQDALDTQIRLDNYVIREQSMKDTELALRVRYPDELSQKILELSEKLSAYKLAELKANRETSLIREREEYYMRVNKTQTDQIQSLEEQVASHDATLNERETFWRQRFNDQLKLMSKNQQQTENQFNSVNSQNPDRIRQIVRDGIQSSNNDLILQPTTPHLNPLSQSVLDMDQKILQDKINFLEDDIKYKDLKIQKLEQELQARQIGINYRTDNMDTLVIGDMEAKTRDMATAAQQTIITMQQMLEEKNALVDEREKKISRLREELGEKSKEYIRMELENENLKRQLSVGEHNRMNVEQFTALRTMEKISKMDQKEVERTISQYENKLQILANELTEAERVNRELLQNLRHTKGENAGLTNARLSELNVSEYDHVKKELAKMTDLYKKKCAELKKLNSVLTDYTLDLQKKQDEITKLKSEEGTKLIISRNENAPHEAKIALLTTKFNQINEKVKEDQKTINELKSNELKNRVLITELRDKLDKGSSMAEVMKDENARITGKKLAVLPTVGANRRPSSAAKVPNAGSGPWPAQPPLTATRSSEEVNRLRTDVQKLLQENEQLRSRVNKAPGSGDFIDENGYLYQKGAMGFTSLPDIIAVFRRYMDYVGPSTNLFSIMKRADLRGSGFVPPEQVAAQLEQAGIRMDDRGKATFAEYVPKDKYGNMDYRAFYYMVKGNIADKSTAAIEDMSTTPANKPMIPIHTMTQRVAPPQFNKEPGMHAAVLDKNVDLLKKKLLEKEKEVADLNKHLKHWKQQALQFESELKDKNNTGRNQNYGVNSTLAARLGRQGENLKQIQDLEEQVRNLKKEMKYEIDKREQILEEMKEDLVRKSYDLNLAQSESKNLRAQLDRVISSKLQKDQVLDERDKEKDLLIASLMERLERSRKAEDEIRTKLRAIERENIDLKHVKEGIDTRLESLNREIRELKDKRKPE